MINYCFYEKIVWRRIAAVILARLNIGLGAPLEDDPLEDDPSPLEDGVAGESTLPRMIGRPSLPLPMTTTLLLEDCASCKVASMPRQRR